MDNGGPESPSELSELRRVMREHLVACVAMAQRGVAMAHSAGSGEDERFFERCLGAFMNAQGNAPEHHNETSSAAEAGEQVSAASFASGDGADDAQVTPERGRGKPGTWPSY